MKTTSPPKFLPTGKMAHLLGVSADFLRRNRGVIFEEGIHYTIPAGLNRTQWKVEAMQDWAIGKMQVSHKAQQVLDRLLC